MDQEATVGGVRIVNRNDFTIADMYDGVPYTFPTDSPVTVPPDAANHIFGWRLKGDEETDEKVAADMLLYCQKRHGWNTPEVVRAGNHTKWFGKLEFKSVRFRMVEVDDDESALTIATPPRQRRDKLAEAIAESEARHREPR